MSNVLIEEDQKLPYFAVLCYFHVRQVTDTSQQVLETWMKTIDLHV